MKWEAPQDHPLRRMFAGYAECTFQQTFGVADPPLIDYLSGLMSRFIHADAIHRLKDTSGRRLDQVAEMVAETVDLPAGGRSTREIHRHIGDFALFWTGVYPEALKHFRAALQKDFFIDYCQQGKRSYYLASKFDQDPYREESAVLRRLADEFEMCAFGLTKVREEWEKDCGGPTGRVIGVA